MELGVCSSLVAVLGCREVLTLILLLSQELVLTLSSPNARNV